MGSLGTFNTTRMISHFIIISNGTRRAYFTFGKSIYVTVFHRTTAVNTTGLFVWTLPIGTLGTFNTTRMINHIIIVGSISNGTRRANLANSGSWCACVLHGAWAVPTRTVKCLRIVIVVACVTQCMVVVGYIRVRCQRFCDISYILLKLFGVDSMLC